MAIIVSQEITNLLAAGSMRGVVMAEVMLDSATIYLCDDTKSHIYNGQTYLVGAFAEINSLQSVGELASESFTVTIDGNRLKDAGIPDDLVDSLLYAIMNEPLIRRRVNFYFGMGAIDSENIEYRIPIYAGYITNTPVEAPLEESIKITIQLDSIAERYNENTQILRTDEGHQSIFLGDKFYEHTAKLVGAEQEIYWGKANSAGAGRGTRGRYLDDHQQQRR